MLQFGARNVISFVKSGKTIEQLTNDQVKIRSVTIFIPFPNTCDWFEQVNLDQLLAGFRKTFLSLTKIRDTDTKHICLKH